MGTLICISRGVFNLRSIEEKELIKQNEAKIECFPVEEIGRILNSEIITKQDRFINEEKWFFDQFINHICMSEQKKL